MKSEEVIELLRKSVGDSINQMQDELTSLEDGSDKSKFTVHSMARLMHYKDVLDYIMDEPLVTRFQEVHAYHLRNRILK